MPFVIRWCTASVVLAGATALASNQPPSTSQEPDGPAGRIAIASKTPGVMIGARTLTIRHQIPVGTLPIGIAVPNERFAYAANMGDDTISVIDIRRGVVVRTIPAGDDPDGIVFLPG
jgi:YVTN family beta-propeller protein